MAVSKCAIYKKKVEFDVLSPRIFQSTPNLGIIFLCLGSRNVVCVPKKERQMKAHVWPVLLHLN